MGAAQLGCGAAVVGDLAGQCAVEDQPQGDGAFGVTDGVGDQFADDQCGGVLQICQVPRDELGGGEPTPLGDRVRGVGQGPGSGAVGVERPGAGEQQDRVVAGL